MLPIVKCLAMALTLLAVGGCAYRDALVLENGEKVDSLYYHESRMPDEVMVEMWNDAMGWESCRFDGMRLDLALEGREWRRLVHNVERAHVEAWPGINGGQSASPLDATAYYLRLRAGDKTIERFAVGAAPKKFEGIQSVIQFALSHKDLYMLPGDVPSGERLPAGAE